MVFDASRVRAILFDLDGTLIDSTADLALSGNFLRAACGLGPLTEAQVAALVGDGLESLVRRLLGRPEGDVEAEAEAYRRHYHEHCLDHTRPIEGVPATLQALRRRLYKMAVVTNKPEGASRRILVGLGLADLFEVVVGGNSCPHKKPHPQPLFMACEALNVRPQASLMVGDSRVDVEAGRNAGMPTVAIPGSIGDRELLGAAGADRTIARFGDLMTLLPEQAGKGATACEGKEG